jgi:hypothetical protein
MQETRVPVGKRRNGSATVLDRKDKIRIFQQLVGEGDEITQ